MKHLIKAAALIAMAGTLAHGDTTQTGPSVYVIDAGVTFTILNQGLSNFLLTWTDATGTYSNIPDPTIILTAGETYIFNNNTTIHPFVITTNMLPASGTDGHYVRQTTSGSVIDATTLQPIADFTASPNPALDVINWTPTNADIGLYFFTCRITFHIGMIGRIEIVAGPPACPADMTGDGLLNFFDVSAFLTAFSIGDPAADFNNDGNFNFFDVSAFLGAFAAGCP